MNIAVVGSRTFKDYEFVCDVLTAVQGVIGDFTVTTGGADGADSLAIRWANAYSKNFPVVHPAHWDDLSHPDAVIKTKRNGQKYDAAAGFRRNQYIIDDSDMLIAFTDPVEPTSGTADSIQKAVKKGIPVYIYHPNHPVVTRP